MSAEPLLINQYGSIVYLTLNRPEKRNALNADLIKALKKALILFHDNTTVRAIVISGKGQDFCSGADLETLQAMQYATAEQNLMDSQRLKQLFQQIRTYPKIVVAQVTGNALAGGCGLATVCDFCFASEDAKFGYTEHRIGFIPALVSTYLPLKVGATMARELLLMGDIISAERAQEIGLINAFYPLEDLTDKVNQFLKSRLPNLSPQAIALTKQLLYTNEGAPLGTALENAAVANAKARETADCKKGIASFLNKQKITW